MAALLPDSPSLRIKHARPKPTRANLERVEHLLVLVPESMPATRWRSLPYGSMLQKAVRRARRSATAGPVFVTVSLPNTRQTTVTVVESKTGESAFERLTRMRRALARIAEQDPGELSIATHGLDEALAKETLEAAVAAALAAALQMPEFKSKAKPGKRLKTLRLIAAPADFDAERLCAEAHGNDLARWLTALPANELTAASYRARVEQLASRLKWQMQFFDEKALRRKGAGAFLAVSQGNATRDAGIIRLRYRPEARRKQAAVALVGKGICFDTGGTNLKPFKYMLDMHQDMQGSAVALGVLVALTELRVPFPVDCWLAVSENRIGPTAYKSQDLVTASNGTTIQVIHTDAEGRMVLADALALAARDKPGVIIDYATLTGACVAALSTRYSGVFTNRPELHDTLIAAGRASGERVWPFPIDADYDTDLESPIADIMQCAVDNQADHILASRFLSRFVPAELPWIHIDLSSGQRKGGLGHVPTDITGFGVRYTLNLLLEQQLLDAVEPAT